MPVNTWSSNLNYVHAGTAGAAYASSTTITDVSAAPQFTFAAYQLVPGSVIRVTASGVASNTGTPTLLMGVYYGGVAGTALAATSAITTTTAMTNWTWRIEYVGIVRTAGTSGTIIGAGKFFLPTSLTAWTIRPIPETSSASTVTIDTTAAKTLTIGATWGTNNASNTLTLHQFLVESVA